MTINWRDCVNIKISPAAAEWFKREYDIEGETNFRFFVRYGGVGGNVPGFSLGVNIETPSSIHASQEIDDLLFYIEEQDAWYFDEKDLLVTLDEDLGEPQFSYQ